MLYHCGPIENYCTKLSPRCHVPTVERCLGDDATWLSISPGHYHNQMNPYHIKLKIKFLMENYNPALTFWFATGTGVANWTPRTWRRLMLTLRRSCAVMQCTRLWLRSGKDEQSLLVYCRSSDSLNRIFKLSYHEIITRYNVLAIFFCWKDWPQCFWQFSSKCKTSSKQWCYYFCIKKDKQQIPKRQFGENYLCWKSDICSQAEAWMYHILCDRKCCGVWANSIRL